MKLFRVIAISGAISILTTVTFRLVNEKWSERFFNQIAADACEVLIPAAQVGGSTKNVFEEAQSVLRRHLPEPDFAVEIVENGARVFAAPPGNQSWYSVPCNIPGRIGLAINFVFKSNTVFDVSLIGIIALNMIWISLVVLILEWALKAGLAGIQERSFQELSNALGFADTSPPKSMLSSIIRKFIASPSVQKNIRGRIEALKGQIAGHEKRNMELIASKIEREQAAKRTNDFLEIVHQIQHDIQGPIQSLAGLIERSSTDETDRQILTSLFHKVQGMVTRLAVQEQVVNPSLEGVRDQVAEVLIQEVVQEKRIVVNDRPIEIVLEFEKANLNLITVDRLQFSRVISNLIQNAIEALPGHGKVSVSVRRHQSLLFVVITDTGRGIAKNKLPMLFNKGATFDKPGGQGLGLHHAKSCLQRWGGDVSIESTVGVGTSIFMQIPVSQTAATVVGEIKRDDSHVNIVVDDDVGVFSRLQPQLGNKSLYFATAEEFESWQKEMGPSTPTRYIFDYGLSAGRTGVELIAKLEAPHDAILITAEYDRPEIILASSSSGFQIFPKVFLPGV